MFEKRALRRLFGPKREEVAKGWRILHNEELHNLYTSPNIIRVVKSRRVRWAGHVAHMGEIISAYNIFIVKLDWTIPCRRCRWEDKIRMNFREACKK
jgi:hypothetical protein